MPSKEEWVAALWFITLTVVEEVVDGLVCKAAQTSNGFGGEIQSMVFGVIHGEGMLHCELHGCAGGASGDVDVLLSWFFRGDGFCEEGVVVAIQGLGNGVVISRTVVEV